MMVLLGMLVIFGPLVAGIAFYIRNHEDVDAVLAASEPHHKNDRLRVVKRPPAPQERRRPRPSALVERDLDDLDDMFMP